LDLMYRANFRSVVYRCRTPLGVVAEIGKLQNLLAIPLAAKLARIQNAGLDINAGFIVGFDRDDQVFSRTSSDSSRTTAITLAMVGMLQAIPRTPLYERLQREHRLVEQDLNCNFVPKQ